VITDLRDRNALVTGAQRGIGAAIARRLTAAGARAWVNAVEELGRARELASELGSEAVEADVSDPDQVERMLAGIGPLDILVNNAADQTYQPILEADDAAWDRTLAVNLTGPLHTIKLAAPSMPAGASIVDVASIHSFVALRGAVGLVHHSDHGSQYTRLAFGRRCGEAGIARSMGSVGDCFDNALAEAVWASLTKELLDRRAFATRDEARSAFFAYVEGFYNPRRRHSALGYLAPAGSSGGRPRPNRSPPERRLRGAAGEGPATRRPRRRPGPRCRGPRAARRARSLRFGLRP
jgi:NAD(P)-dependent dehydrogenase (short-subunit alcohol dehydrogenase family)